jgi:hypothetical protein
MEAGAYQPGSDTTYAPGEVFRVGIVRGKARYTKNGRMVYESRRVPRYPLVMAVALGTIGATVQNARIDANDRSFTTNQYGADRYGGRYPDDYAALDRFDRNGDGVITRREWQGPRADFNELDINRDGVLSGREIARGSAASVGTSGEQVVVDGRQRWVDTGLWVEAGDSITFDAQGTVQLSGNANDIATPAGAESGRRAGNAPLRARATPRCARGRPAL